MPTATIEVSRVDGHLHFSVASDPSGTVTIMDSVHVQLFPTVSNATYAITFHPVGDVSTLGTAVVTSIEGSPIPGVSFDFDPESSGSLIAECIYPMVPPAENVVAHFQLDYNFTPNVQVLPETGQDPTFIFKPPS